MQRRADTGALRKSVLVNNMLDTEHAEETQRYTENRFSVFSEASLGNSV
jgi:hypothetical protein